VVYTVTTLNGTAKAVELATRRHAYLHPEDAVSDANAVELGRVPRSDDGTLLIPKGDLIDRMEW